MRPRHYHHPYMHPYHHPHHYPHMHHPSCPMYLHDGRSPSSQAIYNTYVPATMSIQQLNIQNLSPIGPPGELRASAIHNYASTGDIPDSQQQQIVSSDPEFRSILNDLLASPPNLNVDDGQPRSYHLSDDL